MFGSKDPTCPFFAFFSLADILDAASPDGIVVGYSQRWKLKAVFVSSKLRRFDGSER